MKHYFKPVLYKASAPPGDRLFVLPTPAIDQSVNQDFKMKEVEIPLQHGSNVYGVTRRARVITISGAVEFLDGCDFDEVAAYQQIINLDQFLTVNSDVDRFELFTIYDDETPFYVKFKDGYIINFNYHIRDNMNESPITYSLTMAFANPFVWTTAPGA